MRAAQGQDDSGHGPLQSGKRRCRVRDVDTIPAPKEPTEPVHDRVLLPSSCSTLAAAGQWDRAGRCTWIMQQHLVRRRRAVSQTAGTESRGPRPPGAPSGAWSLLAVRRPTVKRNDPPGGKPGACQHVAEVPVSLSFSTGRADVLRMGWRRGQRAHLCPCMHTGRHRRQTSIAAHPTSQERSWVRNVRRRGDSSVAAESLSPRDCPRGRAAPPLCKPTCRALFPQAGNGLCAYAATEWKRNER